jgi:hypothetical protein
MTTITGPYITPIADEALNTFLNVWSEGPAGDIAQALTCTEADALAQLLSATGFDDAAEAWIDAHSLSDEEGDAHYRQPTVEYIVPVDPMDALQCESCQ